MAEIIISEVVSVIIKTLGSGAYKKIMFTKDLNSHIKRLQQLKTTIEATILDAKSLDSCTNAQNDVLEKIDCALADLDYFLDVISAKAKQKEIMQGNKFIKELRLFFSASNQLVSPFRDAHKLKVIIEKFESISRDQALVRDIISVPSVRKTQMVSTGSLQSNCHILTEVVIGRDIDRDMIVSMLLDDSLPSNSLSVASIVGIGGVGKTTLAKYVFHDERLQSSFDFHLWVSMTQDFDVQKVLLEILATFRHQMPTNYDIVQMYDFFKQAIREKKLLLVLDNVWDQEGLRQKWLELRSLLALGANGSKVLVTTRNEKVARIMDCVEPFMLGDLTEEDSWLLFQKIAFTQLQELGVEAIGKEIATMCHNVPLVIRSIGGLLAGKYTVMEWQAFRDDQLANFSSYGFDIMQTLKLSYDQLDERLKHCVAYCSLFPKGYKYNKDEMIRLWISLGYIEPSYERQRLEDAAEECILMLAIQGFFNIDCHYMLMHDLMHDLVLSIVDFKYKMVKASQCEIDVRVRHLSIVHMHSETEASTNFLPLFFKLKQLQSLLVLDKRFEWSKNLWVCKKMFYNFPRLRILSLSAMKIQRVSRSLSELITLRYLDLSHNPITRLPNSITQLVELLSLDVSCCFELEEFPRGIKKLLKLRHIKNIGCPALIPKGVAGLTELQSLDELHLKFSEGFTREANCGLAELNVIINRIKVDGLTIIVFGEANSKSFKAKKEVWEIKYNLGWLELKFEGGGSEGDKMVLEALQSNTNLRDLVISGYKGERLPKWIKDGIHYFENLVDVKLLNLEGCKSIGSFGRLIHLKSLFCDELKQVEYIEENWWGGTTPYSHHLFPSLEQLWLIRIPKLKKWYKVVSYGKSSSNSSIQDNFLFAPKMAFPKLKELRVTNMALFVSMTREFGCFSSLQSLEISNCEDLKALPDGDGISSLSNLKDFRLYKCCKELKEMCREPTGDDWPKIKHIPFINTISSKDFISSPLCLYFSKFSSSHHR